MIKRLVSIFLALFVIFSFSVSAFADYATDLNNNAQIEEGESNSVQPRAEEKEWVYRVFDGNVEKRLWSNTYGKWLTDWIYVCPAP